MCLDTESTAGGQTGKAVEPLGGRALLEKVDCRRQAFWIYSLTPLLVHTVLPVYTCYVTRQPSVSAAIPSPPPWTIPMQL